MTTEAPWHIKADQREQRTFTVRDGNGDPVDVTGWVVDAKIRDRKGGIILHTFTDDQIDFVDGGKVQLTIPAPVSARWAWTRAWFRITVTDPATKDDPDPDRSRALEGDVFVDPD